MLNPSLILNGVENMPSAIIIILTISLILNLILLISSIRGYIVKISLHAYIKLFCPNVISNAYTLKDNKEFKDEVKRLLIKDLFKILHINS